MDTIDDGIWEARYDIRLPGGFYFNSRMTIVDLGDGELLVHSPIPIDDGLAHAIRAKGDVRWIVAPNDMHHMYLPDAVRHFPDAEVWGPAGARRKQGGIDFAGALEESTPTEWRGIEAQYVAGTRGWAESVFFLPDRRTLLCSDLVFNIHETRNRRTAWLLKLVGAHRKLAQSASVRWLFTKDKARVGDAFSRILSWDFDRVVMGHGALVESDGRQKLAPLLSWAVDTSRKVLPA